MTNRMTIMLTSLALAVAFAPTALAEEPEEEIPDLGPAWAAECLEEMVCIASQSGPTGELGAPLPLEDTSTTTDPDVTACESPEPGTDCWLATQMDVPTLSGADENAAADDVAKESVEGDGGANAERTVPSAGVLALGAALAGSALLARRRA